MGRALATFVLGLALVLGGAVFDSASLYVPGVALALLSAGAVAWVELAARGATVVRGLGPARVEEEQPYPLRLELRSGLLPPPGGELDEPLLGWPVPIAGGWSKRIRINVRFSRRGRHRLEPARLVIRDPLGLRVRELAAAEHRDEVLVLPRVEPVESPGGSGGGSGAFAFGGSGFRGSSSRLDGSAAEMELDGLRPYREGTSASRIHWASYARTGDMTERRLVADMDSAPLVVLDAARPASEEALDMAVRAAASLCVHLARDGGCAVFLPGDRRPLELGPELGGWPQLHARLALVGAGTAAPPGSRLVRGGAVLWVTGATGMPRALDRVTAPVRILVTPSPLAGRRPAFTVAGCTGQMLGRGSRAAGERSAA